MSTMKKMKYEKSLVIPFAAPAVQEPMNIERDDSGVSLRNHSSFGNDDGYHDSPHDEGVFFQKNFVIPFDAPADQEPSNNGRDFVFYSSFGNDADDSGCDDAPHKFVMDEGLKLVGIVEKASSLAVCLLSERERIANLEGLELEQAKIDLSRSQKFVVHQSSCGSEVERVSNEVAPPSRVRKRIEDAYDFKDEFELRNLDLEVSKKEIAVWKERFLANTQRSGTVTVSIANVRKPSIFKSGRKDQSLRQLPSPCVLGNFTVPFLHKAQVVLNSFRLELGNWSISHPLVEIILTVEQFCVRHVMILECHKDMWQRFLSLQMIGTAGVCCN